MAQIDRGQQQLNGDRRQAACRLYSMHAHGFCLFAVKDQWLPALKGAAAVGDLGLLFVVAFLLSSKVSRVSCSDNFCILMFLGFVVTC